MSYDDPAEDLWKAMTTGNTQVLVERMRAHELLPAPGSRLRGYPAVPAADELLADVLMQHRDLERDEAMRERLRHERDSEPRHESLRDYERREFD